MIAAGKVTTNTNASGTEAESAIGREPAQAAATAFTALFSLVGLVPLRSGGCPFTTT
jgi:hypothetical protein